MSGLGGLFHLDGRPASPLDLQTLSEALAARGPDGAGAWHAGAVGLVHRRLRITPESQTEQQPLASVDGRHVIVADARLDNRADLCARLREADTGQPDAALILAAYARWGEACAEQLLGDFAFAIWDQAQQRLFCARDYFGARPFFYYHTSELFAFASSLPALLKLPHVPRQINERRVAGYLLGWLDYELTFYTGVQRLMPAYTLSVAAEGLRTRRYWTGDEPRETRLPSDAAYAEAFRAVLSESVRARVRSTTGAGVMLSGGIDSSTITTLAQPLTAPPLHTFSFVFDQAPESDEREFIGQLTARPGIEAHWLPCDDLSPLARMDELVEILGEPFYHTGLSLNLRINEAAQAAGVRTLLDGNYGDSVVSNGTFRVAELLGRGHVPAALREVAGLSQGMQNRPQMFARLLWHFGLRHLVPEPVRRWRYTLTTRPPSDRPFWAAGSFIHPEFARGQTEALGLAHARPEPPTRYRSELELIRFEVGRARTRPEWYNQLAAIAHVEPSHPFLDRRVVEFCLGLPTEQRMDGGMMRVILRRAMQGRLPETIRLRRNKIIPVAGLARALLTRDLETYHERLRAANLLGEWVDLPAVEGLFAKLDQAAKTGNYADPHHRETMRELGRVLSLAIWAQHEQAR